MNNKPWGSISGVRPVKIVRKMLEDGLSPSEVKDRFAFEFGVSENKLSLAVETAIREIKLLNCVGENDICLYIGIPFCRTRCLYCSFITSESGTAEYLVEPFLTALGKEMTFTAEIIKKHSLNIVSVYFGGGTPTILSEKHLTKLIGRCKMLFDLSNIREFTVEAGRPDTLDEKKLTALKEGGVTRLCINPQSMKDSTLRTIGRRHTSGDITNAVLLARRCGFLNINMDVIAGLPFENEDDFKYTLSEVEKLSPEGVTVHTMSVKRGSRLHEALGDYALTKDETVEKMVDYAADFMKSTGRNPYYLYRQKNMLGSLENVGYALEGFECLYNVLMMEEAATVISLGGGGVTKTLNRKTGKIERIFNVKEPRDYINRIDEMLERKKLINIYL